MKKVENKEQLFYISIGIISFLAVVIIIMMCKSCFQKSDAVNISVDTETFYETNVSETCADNESSTHEKFFGVDIIEIG